MAYMGAHELRLDKPYFNAVIDDIKNNNDILTKHGKYRFVLTKELKELHKKFNSGKDITVLMKNGKNFKTLFVDEDSNSAFAWSLIDKTPYSIGDSIKPSTAEQERITLDIFEELLSLRKTKTFEELVHSTLVKRWDKITKSDSWYKSFKLQYDDISKETKIPNNSYNIFDRDAGLMDIFTKIAKNMGFSQKDSWNPADIWLSKKSAETTKIIKACEEVAADKGMSDEASLAFVNDKLRYAYKKSLILGISLKKNDGKKLNYELVNLELKAINKTIYGKFNKMYINPEMKNNNYKLVSSKIILNYKNKNNTLAIRRAADKISNIVYEFSAGGAAQLGKVPVDQLKKITLEYVPRNKMLIENWQDLPQTSGDINDREWMNIFKIVKSSDYITFVKNITPEQMLNDLKTSYTGGKLNKQNVPFMMIIKFAYTISYINKKDIDKYMTQLFYAAQKKGKNYGGFGKLY